MNRFDELDEFVAYVNKNYKNNLPYAYKKSQQAYYIKNKKKHLEYCKKYEQTEKGKKIRKQINSERSSRFENSRNGLSFQEREEIKKFYLDCPETHHVDHIKPLSRGGKHRLWNLQHLEKKKNLQKYNNILFDVEEFDKYPHCMVD
jgi:5-methylcytosine-specific restriction endonuclease McrA